MGSSLDEPAIAEQVEPSFTHMRPDLSGNLACALCNRIGTLAAHVVSQMEAKFGVTRGGVIGRNSADRRATCAGINRLF